MSKPQKKGLSMEEKVVKVERWFHQHPQPYTLKELLAQVPRATGVIFQSIEECLELLVSEGRVCQDKVGVHTLFWWFPLTEAQREWQRTMGGGGGASGSGPSGAGPQQQKRAVDELAKARAALEALPLDALEAAHAAAEAEYASLEDALSARQTAIGTSDDRLRDAALVQAHLHDRHLLQQKLSALALYDDRFLQQLRDGIAAAREAANRWTDNYFLLEQHICATMGRTPRELRRSLNVPIELDFIDEAVAEGCAAHAIEETEVSETPCVPDVEEAVNATPVQAPCVDESSAAVVGAATEAAEEAEDVPPAAMCVAEGTPEPQADRAPLKTTRSKPVRRRKAKAEKGTAVTLTPMEEDVPATTAVATPAVPIAEAGPSSVQKKTRKRTRETA